MIYSFLLHNMSIGPLYRNPDTENDTVLSENLIFVFLPPSYNLQESHRV